MTAIGPVNYKTISPPAKYRCSKCGTHGCKLWRQYQTFLDHINLLCVACAEADQCKRLGVGSQSTDQIGWLIPAVPTKEGDTFWGYSAVPPAGVAWWKALPMAMPAAPPEGAPKP